MSKILICSDTHFSHKNIVGPKISNWASGYRHFDSIEQMNETILKGINDNVQQDDQLLLLGDFIFGDKDKMQEMRNRIICQDIIYILGNHDYFGAGNRVENGKIRLRDSASKIKEVFGKDKVFTTLEFEMNGIKFFCSHYAHRVWDKSHKNSIHLYAHSHDSLDKDGTEWGKSMDVSFESAYRILGEMRPFNLVDDILPIMDKRKPKILDHHGDGSEIKKTK